MRQRTTYHHGDLRTALLSRAADEVARRGADGVSLRELARQAGVSHGAPKHHFTDRRGLFTALATEGFTLLTEALRAVRGNFLNAAVAYVRFANKHPGHYAVMFDWSLIDPADSNLVAAHAAASSELARGVALLKDSSAVADRPGAEFAAWSLMHGFCMLWYNGALPANIAASDPFATAERIAVMLFDK